MSLRVADKGKGIAPEDHERIFKRFERAETIGDTRGLGLGLYITREIVTMHGGEIKVLSRPSEGAEFIVSLPVSAPFEKYPSRPYAKDVPDHHA